MGLIFNIISIKAFKLSQKPMTFIKIKAKDIKNSKFQNYHYLAPPLFLSDNENIGFDGYIGTWNL